MEVHFSTVLEARKAKTKVPADLGRADSVHKRAVELWSLLPRAWIPFLRALSSGSNYLPKAPPPNTATHGLWGGLKHSAHNWLGNREDSLSIWTGIIAWEGKAQGALLMNR